MLWKMDWDKAAIYIGIAGVVVLVIRRAVLNVSSKCPSRALMTGKTVIVTGANCGIGYTTALDLARRKARVILACRNETAASNAAKRISRQTGNESVIAKHLDLTSLTSVRTFCAEIANEEDKVDVLINNAGVLGCPYRETEDGFETHMAVNHFGNFLLTNLLKDSLYKAPSSRIVFVNSCIHKRGKVNIEDMNSVNQYKTGRPYTDSKLANILFARELHKREPSDSKLCVYSVHPGMALTNIIRHLIINNNYFRVIYFPLLLALYPLQFLFFMTVTEACQTVVYCAVASELEGQSDCYYSNCRKEKWSAAASDMEMAKRVREVSAKLCHYDN